MVLEILRMLVPGSIAGVRSIRRLASSVDVIVGGFSSRINMTLLLPHNEEHQREFKRIITNERIVFTSSWIDKWFGVDNLTKYKNNFALKLELAASGDAEILLPPEVLQSYKNGSSSTQLALDRFFSDEKNAKKLSEIYLAMTSKAEKTGLGYFKFENQENILVGGGALAPVSDGDSVDRVDIALHILDQKKGIGSACLGILLDEAFKKHEVKEVVGSSLLDHRITPTLCARQGMIIINDEKGGRKLYFIDRAMFEAALGKSEKIQKNFTIAATHYDKDGTSFRS